MARRTLDPQLRRYLEAALTREQGRKLFLHLQGMANRQPDAVWFNLPLYTGMPVATTPNVFEWSASSWFGRIHVEQDKTIANAHLHMDRAHAADTLYVELWRNRGQTFGTGEGPGTMTQIAAVTVSAGESDGCTIGFAFGAGLDDLQAGDYLHIQVAEEPGGSGWRGFVDVHYDPVAT